MKKVTLIILFFLVFSGPTQIAGGAEKSPNPTCPGKKRALIFSGGGIRGAYQAGAIWYLVKILGCDFSYFIGTSTGAISAALLSQANGFEELSIKVDSLVKSYKDLEDSSGIAEPRYLSMLGAAVLPLWVAPGGMYSLEPLARRLRREIDPQRVKNLSVPALSLQSGRVMLGGPKQRYPVPDPSSLIDYIIGSASIPFYVEPRTVRLWVPTLLKDFHEGILTIVPSTSPGISDPNCEIRLEQSWTLRCERLSVDRENSWQTTLRLPTLSDNEQKRLLDLISTKAIAEVSSIHQIVDGGVTDYIFWEAMPQARQIDTYFLLTTSVEKTAGTDEAMWKAKTIGWNVFEWLWDRQQGQERGSQVVSLSLFHQFVEASKWAQSVLKWREAMARLLGQDKLEDLEKYISVKFPNPKPTFLTGWVDLEIPFPDYVAISPKKKFFKGPFDVKKDDIRGALYHGCSVAAHMARKGFPLSTVPLFDDPKLEQIGAEPLCDPLKS